MYPREKWYLKTWFICLLFIFWPTIVSPFLGLIFLIMQNIENKKIISKYAESNMLDNLISSKQFALNQKENEINLRLKERDELNQEINALIFDSMSKQYNFSDYDGLASEECKNKLSILKIEESELIKSDKAIYVNLELGKMQTKKSLANNGKQILRTFNCECDNILLNLSVKNIDSSRNKMQKSFDTLNTVFSTDGVALEKKLLELKLEELNLIYTAELKKAQEQAQQKAIKEQMLEEEKVRREIEKEKAKIEKDQSQCNNEISKLMKYLQKTSSDIEKQLYIDKIKELEDKLKQLEADKTTVLERETNARAGYVYIISNIGSFGDDIYKIGMTRRLEPMDRIKELSSASVPFEFDVHAMIFSTDAPSLETSLHKHFEKQSVNKINPRKEFFKVSLDKIEAFVLNNYNNTVSFTKTAMAKEYRQSLQIIKDKFETDDKDANNDPIEPHFNDDIILENRDMKM